MHLVTSVCRYNRELVYVPGLVIQAWAYAYLPRIRADFELLQLAETVPEGVVHHGVHSAIGIRGGYLKKKYRKYFA